MLLDRLLETALHAGKRARAETAIGAGHVSMSSSAVAAAVDTVGLRGRRVLVVGAGETARLAARHAADHDPAVIVIANRSRRTRAEALAQEVRRPGDAARLADRGARRGRRRVLGHERAGHGDRGRRGARRRWRRGPDRPLLVLDLAVPRDVDAAAADVPGVTLRTLDTIRAAVDQSLSTRSAEVPQVEAIVAEESERFSAVDAQPRGDAYARGACASTSSASAARSSTACCGHASDEERQRAERLTRVLVNRLLHVPMLRLKETDAASTDGQLRLQAARDLFALGVSFDTGRRHDA